MADETEQLLEIPVGRLDGETLRRLIEEFVTREGTDYGTREKSLDQKVADLATGPLVAGDGWPHAD